MRTVTGHVVLLETGKGIGGLVVSATAKIDDGNNTEPRMRRLGSDVTRADGQFEIEYETATALPEVTITVAADKIVLAEVTRRERAGKEVVNITIQRAKLPCRWVST